MKSNYTPASRISESMKKLLPPVKALVFMMILLFFSSNIWSATKTWNRTAGGSWATATYWTPNGVPAAGDDVIINTDQSAAITGFTTLSLKSLTISGNCELDGSADTQTLTVTGTFTVNSGKTFTIGPHASGHINFILAITATGTIDGVVIYRYYNSPNNHFDINGSLTLNGRFSYDVYSGGAPTMTIPGGGVLTIGQGGYINNSGTGVTYTNAANFTLSSGATLKIGSTVGITTSGATGNIQVTGTRTYSTGANYEYNGSAAQVTGNGLNQNTPANVTINNPGNTITLSAITNISGALTINSGTLDLGIFTANRTSVGGTLTIAAGATLRIGGTNTLPSNYNTHSINATSTIEYYGTAQTVAALNSSQNYGYLILSGSGTKLFSAARTITNDLTITGTAKASLANGSFSTTGTLTLGGVPAGTGTWGSTGSSAVHQDDTYFLSSVSGIINVLSSLCTPPIITGALTVCSGYTTQLTGSGTPAAINPWISETPGVATVSNSGLVTGFSGGTCIITYNNSNGCSNSATVTVNPLPSSSVTGQTNVTCYAGSDGTITISASGGTDPYQFSVDNGATYIPGTNPYNYTGLSANVQYKIRVKDINGCESPAIP
jgi:hypothetical protein